ncbi:site-specific DNA-methyltransferase [Halarsenatibacter silvermanii]|uniref:DNA modification methylase n=1 Tax=Halarsenatibacter silvermanii TaxID=321763 RepID=A0A1G9RAB3_9FIRM|nr:DNA methyltransferase [Halarsenatibacter silvermanii]SDM20164.1 DNA modification methylase [Halarsenatibacter silvermanii]
MIEIHSDVELVRIEALISYINNPKEHPMKQIEKIASSIKHYGFTQPVVIAEDNEIIIGHGRVQAAKKLGLEEVPAIKRDDLSEAEIRALRIADNKVAESEWNMEQLSEELELLEMDDIPLEDVGFSEEDIEEFDFGGGQEVVEDDFNEEVDKDEPAITEKGDVIELGRHRLMCGDSTEEDEVEKLMNGNKANMVFTDPPYNVNYGNIKHEKFKMRSIENDNMSYEEFKNFCKGFINNIKKFTDGCLYVCHAPNQDGRILGRELDKEFHPSTTIIWYKDVFTLGRGKYQNKYEPIWFGWVKDGTNFVKDRDLTNVWEIERPKSSKEHPTMKPIELVATAINHASNKGQVVLDLFGGSGSTLIAAEQLNRTCYMMELDEHYCDVIIRRYIAYRASQFQEVNIKVNDEQVDTDLYEGAVA